MNIMKKITAAVVAAGILMTSSAFAFYFPDWGSLVPVRAIAEAFGAEVNWDGESRTVIINE